MTNCKFLVTILAICAVLQLGNCCVKYENGVCVICDFRQVMVNGVCVTVDNSCKDWDKTNAKCTSCYQGFTLANGVCNANKLVPPAPPKPIPANDPLCNKWDEAKKCIGCQYRAVLVEGICVAVDNSCKDWNKNTAECTDCYLGFQLNAGMCKPNP